MTETERSNIKEIVETIRNMDSTNQIAAFSFASGLLTGEEIEAKKYEQRINN